MPSQWPAVGAETDPLRRARQLQKGWERLLADGALGPELPTSATAGLRPTIVESWRRSLATGLDPTDLLAPIEADESEVLERWFEHPLGSLTHVLTEQLRKVAKESRSMVVVTDASGLVLHRVGDEWLKERAAEMNLVEGARYSEAADGTNGIGTALAADHAFQVFAFEHFNERHHQWVCSGAPVHDPVSGKTVGLIDLSTLWKVAHPRSLELVTTAARAIERGLMDARRERDARLRRRYSDFMTRTRDLLVDRDGYVLDGAEPAHPSPFEIPIGGGEVVLGDGSVAVAAPLGQGEAYLLRRGTGRRAKSAPPIEGFERAEGRARELATEQAALRQVATLVARESSPDQLFAVVAEQVARIFDVPHVRLVRYEPESSVVVGGFSEGDHEPFPIGSRWSLDSPGVIATVRRTGGPARVEDYAHVTGEIAAVVRGARMRSGVASPIVVAGRLWGAIVVLSPRHEAFPEDTEAGLTDFTELVATAIANAESRIAIGRLAEEQAALRRVATLVARGIGPESVFQAVAAEVGVLFGSQLGAIVRFEDDGTVTVLGDVGGPYEAGKRVGLDPGYVAHTVRQTRRSARFDTDDPSRADMPAVVRSLGIRSAVASPIVVQGELWGALMAVSRDVPLAHGAERRLTDFTELVGTAVANTEAREEITALADEQAALRRVATLVAQGAQPDVIFSAVGEEIGRLFGSSVTTVGRFDHDARTLIVVGRGTGGEGIPVGSRWELNDTLASGKVFGTGRSARVDEVDWSAVRGPLAAIGRDLGVVSTVASPIFVEGRLWGVVSVSYDKRLPPEAEERLEKFSELIATAIANAEARTEVQRLADEQAALRRVATLVAKEDSPAEVFAKVAEEAGGVLGKVDCVLLRDEGDGTATMVAAWGEAISAGFSVGAQVPVEGDGVTAYVLREGEPHRIDDYFSAADPLAQGALEHGIRSAVGCPIVVRGAIWGAIVVAASGDEPCPPEAERRLAQFADLVATAIANAEARGEIAQLADEQATLRRIATLVAQGVKPEEVFAAVTEETAATFRAATAVMRFEHDPPEVVVVGASTGIEGIDIPIGYRRDIDDSLAAARVYRTGRSARVDRADWSSAGEPIGEVVRWLGIVSYVASPIIVEGSLWGLISVSAREELPPDTEQRLEKFTELVTTAIANAESKSELAASRRRIVAASDESRRRIERDLHDGTQQRLVSLGLALRAAEANLPPEQDDLRAQLSGVAAGLVAAVEDLQEISRGIHPAILSKGGLGPAVRALAHRSAIPVDLDITIDVRVAEPIEVAAYFVVSEALANAAKHSQASRIDVSLEQRERSLLLSVRDDGVGGADTARGSGLVGLLDRVEALGGSIRVNSRPGTGTQITAELPLELELQQPVASLAPDSP